MLDPIERRKFRLLVRGMLPAPFIYIAIAWGYLALVDAEPFFGETAVAAMAIVVGIATLLWAFIARRIALARGQADARLAQTLLALAHGPGIAGFVLAIGSTQLWCAVVFGAAALGGLLVVRAKVGG